MLEIFVVLATIFIFTSTAFAKMNSQGKIILGANGDLGFTVSGIETEYEGYSSYIGRDAYIISYSGTLVPGVIELNKDKELKPLVLEKKDNKVVFIKSAPVSGELFAALYDKDHDILYPVMFLK